MDRTRFWWVGPVSVICLMLASPAWAQQAGGIAGTVRDTSGAVLPGVTVEAASPALIEKVRVVVSDSDGRYNLVDLRPGTYTVSFTLPGFNTLRREGIALTAGFTATVNADMQVGALEETITVTGESPLVDTQNVRQQTVVSSEMLETLPSGHRSALSSIVRLMPGLNHPTVDVGGTSGIWLKEATSFNATYHGRSGVNQNFDGMGILAALNATVLAGYMVNPQIVQETVVETGGGSAETIYSGVTMNMVPKDGGNTFRFSAEGLFSNGGMQGENFSGKLRDRGSATPSKVAYVYNTGFSAGGPIKQDRVWFFAAFRRMGNRNYEANNYYNKNFNTALWYRYEPDLTRQADQVDAHTSGAGRVTWQASRRNKVTASGDLTRMWEPRRLGNASVEAKGRPLHFPESIAQTTWSSPVSDRLLLEAGLSSMIFHYSFLPQPGVTEDTIRITELSTGYSYNSNGPSFSKSGNDLLSQRYSATYVTGSHAVKAGLTVGLAYSFFGTGVIPGSTNRSYAFNQGVPVRITQSAAPYLTIVRGREFGLYAQDQWAIKRLTLNYGVRWDHNLGWVPAQDIAATEFVPARHYDAVRDVPRWNDVNPRLGIAYDLFGTGRTALKFSVGRYVKQQGAPIATLVNPVNAAVNTVNRTWTDADGDYQPDCELRNFGTNGECGPISNANFGQIGVTTSVADDVREGWNKRESSWDLSTEVQHQVSRNISLTAGYYRTVVSHTPSIIGGANYVTDNLLVTPADFDHFCVTAPKDSRLPGGGGYQVCGLYDVSPSKFGRSDNVVKQPFDFGQPKRVADYVGVSFNTRFESGLLFGGGVDTGRDLQDTCFVVDSPQELLHCRVVTPWMSRTLFKLSGSYPLPRDFSVSAVFQNAPGAVYGASYTATNAEVAPSLGRNLAACGTRLVGCTAFVTVPLLPPTGHYEERMTQLDLRLTKAMRLSAQRRLQVSLDVYNVLNADTILGVNSAYGARWRVPITAMPARLFQVSGQLTF